MKALVVEQARPATTVQDLGRPGLVRLGVGESGAVDRRSLRLANRLLGNAEDAAVLEVTLGGLAVRARGDLLVSVTGAVGPLSVDDRGVAGNSVVALPDASVLTVGTPAGGLRSYLAVRGGIDVPPVLGSRSTDVMSGLGPPPVEQGAVLSVGPSPGDWPVVDLAAVPAPPDDEVELRVVTGPRDDWFTPAAMESLLQASYEVTSDSNRVGMRLHGPALDRAVDDELPSEGVVRGALQVPSGGQPVLFLADHPVTGGYPVIAVVIGDDVDRAGQARPGQHLRFRRVQGKGYS